MTVDPALRRLAGHALSAGVEPRAIGPVAAERLQLSLLDLFGCHLAARALDVGPALVRVALEDTAVSKRGTARARLWGSDGVASPFAASLANGTIAHHAEFDAGWHGPPGVGANAAVSVLPAALAVAEANGASGRAFMAAAAAGYDTLAALAHALCPRAVASRLHPPGLLGAFGAAAAAGRLGRLSADTLASALGACGGVAPLAPFESFTAGASAKDLYGGWPAAIGVAVVDAACRGALDAAPFALPAMLGRPPIAEEEVRASLRAPALLAADFKAYPTCRSVQPALSALDDLLAATPLEAAAIDAIAVETYRYAVDLDEAADPAWPIGARTSIATCLALRLTVGHLDPADFEDGRLHDPALRELAARITVAHGRFSQRPGRGAAIEVRLRDGRRFACERSSERWSTGEPATRAAIVAKFRRLASVALAPADIEALIERTLDLQRCSDLRELTSILARAAPAQARGDGGRIASPACPDAQATIACARRALAAACARRGVDSRSLDGALGATERAADDLRLAPADRDRALTLALALAPCGAGAVPAGWDARQGGLMARLASCGFGGPPGVYDGARGLRWLAEG